MALRHKCWNKTRLHETRSDIGHSFCVPVWPSIGNNKSYGTDDHGGVVDCSFESLCLNRLFLLFRYREISCVSRR